MQALSRRQQEVLGLAVRHYVDTMEPVGSRTLVRRFGLPASPATVRSAMGALEQQGLLTQPHTSAGRVPSQQGYRLYVDQLLPAPGAAALQLDRDLATLSLQWPALDDLLLHLGRRLADLTGLLSLITRPRQPQRQPQLQALRLVPSGDRLLVFLVHGATHTSSHNLRLPAGAEPELPVLERWANDQLRSAAEGAIAWQQLPRELATSGRLLRQVVDAQSSAGPAPSQLTVASGLGKLLAQPDFSHTASLRPLVQLVEEEPERVLGPRPSAVWIGDEHPHAALAACAVVQAAYRSGDGGVGHVALIGPMRMAYATATAAVRSVASSLQRLLS
ncbi:MAG: HrcA family transcriptional regulator [Prochlorococcaceae cyanobacterium]